MLIECFEDWFVWSRNQQVQNCNLYLVVTTTSIAAQNTKDSEGIEA